MSSTALPIPGLRWGSYPERTEPVGLHGWQRTPLLPWGWPGGLRHRAERAAGLALAMRPMSDDAFVLQGEALQQRLLQHGWRRALLLQASAHVAEAARRALGWAAYTEQLMAALAMLDNRVAEMATGEGKSLAAALAAGVGALAGIPVHVLTANDYLVERDAETFAPFYTLLGLQVGFVLSRHSASRRQQAYTRQVVYVTAREVAFDYLRDRLSHGSPRRALQRRAAAPRCSAGFVAQRAAAVAWPLHGGDRRGRQHPDRRSPDAVDPDARSGTPGRPRLPLAGVCVVGPTGA